MKNSNNNNVIKAILLINILLLCACQKNTAQELSFTARAPKVLRAGEQFQLVYTTNGNVDKFTPPDFGEFRYLGGPSTGSSTSISMSNGKTTKTSTTSSRFIFFFFFFSLGKGVLFDILLNLIPTNVRNLSKTWNYCY